MQRSRVQLYPRCCYLYTTHATHLEDNYPDAEGTIAEVATTLSVLYGVLLLPVLVLYRSLELDASNGSSHQPSSPREEELKPPQYHEGDSTQEEYKRLSCQKLKIAIILPTGQWYAPSAVINDAWYCMVLHCIA